MRLATFHAELTRKGPGLLLRDIKAGNDPQLAALQSITAKLTPDILFLTKVDFDAELRTATALKDLLGYEHVFAIAPNTMRPTSFDMDGDGKPGDRHAWARYAGEGAMVLLSRFPITLRYHLNNLLWHDFDDSSMPTRADGRPFLPDDAARHLKLLGQGLWVVDVKVTDQQKITLALFYNQTPVFDGPEDLNGLRNKAQLSLLLGVVDGAYGAFPTSRFALMGNSNLDPLRGQGDRAAMAALLEDSRLQDVDPKSPGGKSATTYWENPGAMRVSYILPSADWTVLSSGVFWPKEGPLRDHAEQASRHRMVWMDLMP